MLLGFFQLHRLRKAFRFCHKSGHVRWTCFLGRYALSLGVNIACSSMFRYRRWNSRIVVMFLESSLQIQDLILLYLNSTPLFTNVSSFPSLLLHKKSPIFHCSPPPSSTRMYIDTTVPCVLMKRHALQSFPSNSFVGRHSPLFHWELVNYSFVSRISKATDYDQIVVEGLCHAGRRLLISEQDFEKGVQPTCVRIAGLKVLCGFREANGCGCGKTTIESPEED
jgi:hypothetical protein